MTFNEWPEEYHLRTLLGDDSDASEQYAGEREQAASPNSPPATDYGRYTCG